MRVTVLGKSPSWQDAGGACSGYLIEEGETALLLDCGNGVFGKLREHRDYTEIDAVVLSHLHADHFLDLVPYSYALTYAPRQQPVPVPPWPGTEHPARPRLIAPGGAIETFRRVVGAWGNEDLVEKAFAIEEYEPSSRPEVGDLRLRFAEVPHFTETFAVEISNAARLAVHVRRRLPPRRGDRRVRPRHRPADDRGDAAPARAHRRARAPDAGGGGRSRPARGRQAGRASPTSPTSSTRSGRASRPRRRSARRSTSPRAAPPTRSRSVQARPTPAIWPKRPL